MSICAKTEVYFIDSGKDVMKSVVVFLPVIKKALKATSFLERNYQNPQQQKAC